MLNDLIEYLSGKRILLLGFGREGRSSLAFIMKHRAAIKPLSVTVADRSEKALQGLPDEVLSRSGEDYLEAMAEADLVLKSPGIPFRRFEIETIDGKKYLKEFPGAEISGQADLFFRFTPAHCIGISGTKGKSTTSTLCYEILCQAKGPENAYLLGNIGVPVWDRLEEMGENSYCAVELSSHQLEFCSASPEVAVLTNFYPEHLDHYKNYEGYLSAKLNLLRNQKAGDTAVLAAFEEELAAKARPEVKGKLLTVGDFELENYLQEKPDYLLEQDRVFKTGGETYEIPANSAMLGRHVLRDALLAFAATSVFGIGVPEQLAAVQGFAGIPHRLEPLGTKRGILFYNDSIATIPQATLLALDALGEVGKVTCLLAGGMDRGIDYEGFCRALYRYPLKHLILFPDTGKIIKQYISEMNEPLEAAKRICCYEAEEMEEAVSLACRLAKPGEICLLSPAASSYNHYKNFEERGNRFREAVLKAEGDDEREDEAR